MESYSSFAQPNLLAQIINEEFKKIGDGFFEGNFFSIWLPNKKATEFFNLVNIYKELCFSSAFENLFDAN